MVRRIKLSYDVRFIKSAQNVQGFPKSCSSFGNKLPEVAVIGRSNVGKSSLLNHLFGKKGLVKTSATPGKTRLVNFFSVEDEIAFVDLPGFGYSQASVKEQEGFMKMVEGYFKAREELKLVLYLFDIRRDPTDADLLFLHTLLESGRPVVVVITKADKIAPTKRATRKKEIMKALGEMNDYILYSVTENVGRDALWHKIDEVVFSE